MEAPEKIYLYPSDRAGEDYEDEWGTMPWGEDYVEYTSTNAFIEKACEFLSKTIWNITYEDLEGNSVENTDKINFIETFKTYIKGE